MSNSEKKKRTLATSLALCLLVFAGFLLLANPSTPTDTNPNLTRNISEENLTHVENPPVDLPDGPQNWTMYEYNGSYVIIGNTTDGPAYLYPNGSYGESPYLYPNFSYPKTTTANEPADPQTTYEGTWNWTTPTTQETSTPPTATTTSPPPATTTVKHQQTTTTTSMESLPGGGSGTTTEKEPQTTTTQAKNVEVATNTSETEHTYAIRGTVYNQQEEPVEDATVHLHSEPRTFTTGPDGNWSFENVTPGNHTLYVEPPASSSLATTRTFNLSMTQDGELRVMGDPENVIFFETTDGTVAENTLRIQTPPTQSIQILGTGSSMWSTLHFEQPLNAENTSITLEGIYTETQQTTTINGTNVSKTFSIDGNSPPNPAQLRLKGEVTEQRVEVSGEYNGTNPEVEIKGNRQPTDASLILQGDTSVAQENENGTAELDTRPTQRRIDSIKSGTETTGTRTKPVRRDGEHAISVDWYMESSSGDYALSGYVYVYACNNNDECRKVGEVSREGKGGEWKSYSETGTFEKTVTLNKSDYLRVSVYCWCDSNSYVKVPDQVVSEYIAGRTPEAVNLSVDGERSPEQLKVTVTGMNATKDAHEIASKSVRGDLRTGDTQSKTYELFEAPRDGHYYLEVPWKLSAWTSYIRGTPIGGEASVALRANGNTLFSKYISTYHSPDDEKTANGTYRTRIYLTKGESVTAELTAKSSARSKVLGNTKGVTTRAPTGYVTVSANNISKTTSYLSPGESQTVLLPASLGTNTVTFQSTGGKRLNYSIEWGEWSPTKNPKVHIDNHTICSFDGAFSGKATCDVPRKYITAGAEETLNITTESGTLNYTFSYNARASPKTATLTINGETVEYQQDFDGSSPVPAQFTEDSTQNTSLLELGENSFSLQSTSVDGLEANATAELSYAGEARQTLDPVVIVTDASGTTHQKSIPDSALTPNGKLVDSYTLSLPADWFSEGENIIRVKTPDGSQVRAVVTASGLNYQVDTFNESEPVSGLEQPPK